VSGELSALAWPTVHEMKDMREDEDNIPDDDEPVAADL
jgi:hypothetical protein